jgi:isopentenyldiphosphate isomerase
MQQRSFNKDTDPGSWSCAVCGHVTYTDMYHTTAVREMEEEIGVSGTAVRFITKIFSRFRNECEFNAVFEACIPKNTRLRFDTSEVQKLQWVSVSRIRSFVHTHDVTPLTRQILTELRYL